MFFNGMFPFLDLSDGGDIDSLVRQLDAILPGLPPHAKIIPGHDPLASPADKFCREIAAKLQSVRFPHDVKHISHEGAGHASFLPYLITANAAPISGGTDKANAAAGFDSWKETIVFPVRYLGR